MAMRIPVLIVGGGGAGLTASMLLATHGVESLVVSALPTTSLLPKAHVLNQRAMEVFTDVGVADAIYARSTPAANMSHTAWYLDVHGEEDAGRRLHKMECWDGGGADPAWVSASPCRQANLPQNVELGFRLASAAVIPDGSREPCNVDDVRVYQPDTRPGSPLPHAWVERAGVRKPLRHVAPPSAFLLVAGEEGEPWCAAAREAAARRGLALVAVRVGHCEGDWLDPRLAFVRVRELDRAGAILVRPDRVIAWRSMGAAADPVGVLGDALDRVLARTAVAS